MKPGIESKKTAFFATTLVQRKARQTCIDKAINSVEIFVSRRVLAAYRFERNFDDNVVQ